MLWIWKEEVDGGDGYERYEGGRICGSGMWVLRGKEELRVAGVCLGDGGNGEPFTEIRNTEEE